MLCGRLEVLNGSQVSILPLARSRRWTAAKPLFCDQTLPSTCALSGRTIFTCEASILYSFGIGQYWNCSVFGSNLTIGTGTCCRATGCRHDRHASPASRSGSPACRRQSDIPLPLRSWGRGGRRIAHQSLSTRRCRPYRARRRAERWSRAANRIRCRSPWSRGPWGAAAASARNSTAHCVLRLTLLRYSAAVR